MMLQELAIMMVFFCLIGSVVVLPLAFEVYEEWDVEHKKVKK